MNTALLIVAHTPLASALRDCVLHVFPEAASAVAAVDVLADDAPAVSEQRVRSALQHLHAPQALVLTDVFGATPCNVAQKVVDGVHARLVAGVNLPMLLRTVNYRHESLDMLVARALSGGTQCIMQVAVTAPLNQKGKPHDPIHHDHHQ